MRARRSADPSTDGSRSQERRPAVAPDAVPTWDEIVEQHSDRVYRLAYRLTGNRPDAEDLTQEVFVRVFRSLSTYTPGTFEGWLHRITTNLFLDQARRKQRIRFDALSDERGRPADQRLAEPRRGVRRPQFDDDIERALATLPPDFRAAVVLCDVEGLYLRGDRRDPRRQARHRPLPHPPWPRHAARRPGPPRARGGPGPLLRPARRARLPLRSRARRMIGHLGPRVSALLDGQLSPAEEERAWAHVHACHPCRDLVEREGWVKTRLAGLSFDAGLRARPGSRARCSRRVAVRACRRASLYLAHDARPAAATPVLVAIGGGAVGAAVMGVLALGAAPADAPSIDRAGAADDLDHHPPPAGLTMHQRRAVPQP